MTSKLISNDNANTIIAEVCKIAQSAGEKILEIYNQEEFDINIKYDNSPVTEADLISHQIIESGLKKITPNIPILSEESEPIDYEIRKNWKQFWLVDPLDGTKEFIGRTGEFSINIALIENNRPILGVIFAPILNTYYYASIFTDSSKKIENNNPIKISCKKINKNNIKIAVSRRHDDDERVKEFMSSLSAKNIELILMGSAIKICAVAEGLVDIYPRFGPTSEWDTAAGQIILERSGGKILNLNDNNSLDYNKKDLINPNFLAISDTL